MDDAVPCPVCGSRDLELHFAGVDRALTASALGSGRDDVGPGHIDRCLSCGLGFRRHRPDAAELGALYRDLHGEVYSRETHGRLATARRHLAIVHRQCTPGEGRLLDVGSASGLFLRAALEAGWDVVGVEPSRTLFTESKEALGDRGGAALHNTTLEEADLERASFDAVTLWDVLEHVPDPVGFMTRCGTLLRPGGFLFVNVPDLESLQARLLARRWPLLLPEHLNYFTRRSLRLSGERAGLRWQRFGRRRASFSLAYILERLSQHRIPLARTGLTIARRLGVERRTIAIHLGELYGVWTA